MNYFVLEGSSSGNNVERLENELVTNFGLINNAFCKAKYSNFEDVFWGYPRAMNSEEYDKLADIMDLYEKFIGIVGDDEISDGDKFEDYERISSELKEFMGKIKKEDII